jgi:50S ribosomal protein L16 3-hydroxylase
MVRARYEPTLTHLGDLAVGAFMRRYWQRRPLLVRQALPGLRTPVPVERLFALAARPDVQSRLVTAFAGRWALREGPLARQTLPARTRRGWTVLVHGVDVHVEAAARLLARFRFVPDARLDDLLVSYASDGGGVGPHVDSYDVFLVQAQGRRRWRIGRSRDLAEVPGLALRILADFRPEREWVLEPGDLLYLPPGIAHEGVAVGPDCVTCSIGFRAPAYRAVAERWFDEALEAAGLERAHRDPGLAATRAPARLPDRLVDAARARMRPPSVRCSDGRGCARTGVRGCCTRRAPSRSTARCFRSARRRGPG